MPTQTSGYATWNPDFLELYEIVAERAGLDTQNGGDGRGGYSLRQFRRDYNLLSQELSNRGLNLGTFDVETLQLQPTIQSYQLPTDTLDLLDGYIRTNAGVQMTQTDFKIERYSQMQYDRIPNKLTPGRPLNWLLQRYTATITVIFWPVPDTAQPYTFLYTRIRKVQNAGKYTDQMDFPYRAIPVVTAGLAYMLAVRKPALIDRVQMLQEAYEFQYSLWKKADSDRSTFRMVPKSNLSYGRY